VDAAFTLINFGECELEKLQLKAFKARFTVQRELILKYQDGEFVVDQRPNAFKETVAEQLAELLRNHPAALGRNLKRLRWRRNFLARVPADFFPMGV